MFYAYARPRVLPSPLDYLARTLRERAASNPTQAIYIALSGPEAVAHLPGGAFSVECVASTLSQLGFAAKKHRIAAYNPSTQMMVYQDSVKVEMPDYDTILTIRSTLQARLRQHATSDLENLLDSLVAISATVSCVRKETKPARDWAR